MNLQTVLRNSFYVKIYYILRGVLFCTKRQSKSMQDRYLETDNEAFDIADVTTAFKQ